MKITKEILENCIKTATSNLFLGLTNRYEKLPYSSELREFINHQINKSFSSYL